MVNPEEYRERNSVWQNASQGALMIKLRPYSVTRIDAARE